MELVSFLNILTSPTSFYFQKTIISAGWLEEKNFFKNRSKVPKNSI